VPAAKIYLNRAGRNTREEGVAFFVANEQTRMASSLRECTPITGLWGTVPDLEGRPLKTGGVYLILLSEQKIHPPGGGGTQRKRRIPHFEWEVLHHKSRFPAVRSSQEREGSTPGRGKGLLRLDTERSPERKGNETCNIEGGASSPNREKGEVTTLFCEGGGSRRCAKNGICSLNREKVVGVLVGPGARRVRPGGWKGVLKVPITQRQNVIFDFRG